MTRKSVDHTLNSYYVCVHSPHIIDTMASNPKSRGGHAASDADGHSSTQKGLCEIPVFRPNVKRRPKSKQRGRTSEKTWKRHHTSQLEFGQ